MGIIPTKYRFLFLKTSLRELTNLKIKYVTMMIKYNHSDGLDSLEDKEDDLDATDDGEPSEETHGASDET